MALFGGQKMVGPSSSQITGNVFLKGTPGSQHFPASLPPCHKKVNRLLLYTSAMIYYTDTCPKYHAKKA